MLTKAHVKKKRKKSEKEIAHHGRNKVHHKDKNDNQIKGQTLVKITRD